MSAPDCVGPGRFVTIIPVTSCLVRAPTSLGGRAWPLRRVASDEAPKSWLPAPSQGTAGYDAAMGSFGEVRSSLSEASPSS